MSDSTSNDERTGLVSAIASGAAIAISIAALLVAVLQVQAQRAVTQAAVWPYIEIESRYNAESFAIEATNRGVGPARVQSFEWLYDGEPVENLDSAIKKVLGDEAFSDEVYRSTPILGRVMSSNQTEALISVPWDERTRRLVKDWRKKLSVVACYCSIYDECWIVRLNEGRNQPVDKCPEASAPPLKEAAGDD